MPISFIIIVILYLYLFMNKNKKLFNLNRFSLFIILTMLLLGYFYSPVNIMNYFSVNTVFIFGILTLILILLIKIKFNLLVIISGIITVTLYSVVSIKFSEAITFINYLPAFLLITFLSLLFIKNVLHGVSYILITYTFFELYNLYYVKSNYINLFGLSYINNLVLSVLIFCAFNFVYFLIYKIKTKKVEYEKV